MIERILSIVTRVFQNKKGFTLNMCHGHVCIEVNKYPYIVVRPRGKSSEKEKKMRDFHYCDICTFGKVSNILYKYQCMVWRDGG
jgi:hypothetical protein